MALKVSDIFKYWDFKPSELTDIINANPSLRGFLQGYISEYKLRQFLLTNKNVNNLVKYDDHDRTRKSDLVVTYKGVDIAIEVKSLQTATVKQKENGGFVGKFQCDASDSRTITLTNNETIKTTCLLVGEFDLLAVNLFEFHKKWVFAFSKNRELPKSNYKKYTPEQRKYLLSTLMQITWPLEKPFNEDPFKVMDEIVAKKRK
ncbi:MAG: restriction endonuclease [Candidatus Diapherotrites archaeon]|uniref:Restriction endonuclease n=1 Tax=Candidatus Iainarchaeum sp. TaxID=3101447 RepID=A0A8T3YK22_9ARCH|nr:restriction endonuclease [Candidatus Diapherotrites archaeon]